MKNEISIADGDAHADGESKEIISRDHSSPATIDHDDKTYQNRAVKRSQDVKKDMEEMIVGSTDIIEDITSELRTTGHTTKICKRMETRQKP